MTAKKAEHPALAPLALIVNEIHNRKVKGSPRDIAEKIINLVFAREADRWEGSEDLYEGGITDSIGNQSIVQNGSQTNGSHHRRVLVFYGPWEEGSPAIKNRHPLTGKDTPPKRGGVTSGVGFGLSLSSGAAGIVFTNLKTDQPQDPQEVAREVVNDLKTRTFRL